MDDLDSVETRRFSGVRAEEISVLVRASAGSGEDMGTRAYAALGEALEKEGASAHHLTQETLLLRDPGDAPAVLSARDAVLQTAAPPFPERIQNPPADPRLGFQLLATAVVPLDGVPFVAERTDWATSAGATSCARSGARRIRLGDRTFLRSSNVYGRGPDAGAQATDMFRNAEALLARAGLTFENVLRTWIHLRDIDRDYDALNEARRRFFQERGLAQRPASTGVQGGPVSPEHDCSLSFLALESSRPSDRSVMSTQILNEAWSYGADFSRGLRLDDGNKIALHVSGTASIDEHGRTVHVGDIGAQARRMLDNIESLLAGQGARLDDAVSGIAYVKHASDAELVMSLCRSRGLSGFPCAVVETPLCRPELLCETEILAALPVERGED